MIPNRKRDIAGCVDLGSSYFRLLVVRCGPAGEIAVLRDGKEYVGWGASVVKGGRIAESDIEAATEALGRLLAEAEVSGCEQPVLVGTNALRSAKNAGMARSSLEKVTGRPIIILTQRGEAELGFRGASSIMGSGAPALLMDVGGTSTEISWGRGGRMEGFEGLAIGTHMVYELMTAGRGSDLVLSCNAALKKLGESLSIHYALPENGQRPTILATGGTAVSLAVILRYMEQRDGCFMDPTEVEVGKLDLALRRVNGLFASGSERRFPLERDRIRLLLPGLVLLTSLMRALRVGGFHITARDLRWGVVTTEGDLTRYSITGESADE
jgi:exopolyphosphatase/guanosine-5'-triphosphate,3'-diphosphate pyrophosphatase